jgi:hypothetical protein
VPYSSIESECLPKDNFADGDHYNLTAKTLIQESGGFIEKLILKKTYDFN